MPEAETERGVQTAGGLRGCPGRGHTLGSVVLLPLLVPLAPFQGTSLRHVAGCAMPASRGNAHAAVYSASMNTCSSPCWPCGQRSLQGGLRLPVRLCEQLAAFPSALGKAD